MKTSIAALVGAVLLLCAPLAQAAPVNGTGLITSNVIMGTGITDGAWTGVSVGGLELALRAKQRFDTTGQPTSVYNYDGDRTYSFDRAGNAIPDGLEVFNFEFSINTDTADADDTPAMVLTDYMFSLTASFGGPGNDGPSLYNLPIGNSYGFNSTPQGGGEEDRSLEATRNVAQNSLNNGFFSIIGFPPPGAGTYVYTLSAFGPSSNAVPVASTSIDVIVTDVAPVPLPAALPLMLAGLGGLAALRRRKRG